MKGSFIVLLTTFVIIFVISLPASAKNNSKAKKAFDNGISALEDHDYKEALISFETAYKASPHWLVLIHIANCHAKLNQPAAAIKAYEQFIAEGGEDIKDSDRELARKNLATQRKKVGALHLFVEPKSAGVRIDGEKLGNQPFDEILLRSGPHHILVIRGDEEEDIDIKIEAGETKTLTLSPNNNRLTTTAAVAVVPTPSRPKAKVVAAPQVATPEVIPEPAPVINPEPEPVAPQNGVIVVNSNIVNSKIALDGEEKGTTPFEEIVSAGPYELAVKAEGYDPYQSSVYVVGGNVNNFEVTLIGEDEKPKSINAPFITAMVVAGAGLVTSVIGFSLYAYNKNKESDWADSLKVLNNKFSWEKDCGSRDVNDKAQAFFCNTESERRDFEKTMKIGRGIGITGAVFTALGGTAAALFYIKPEWFMGKKSNADITLTPLATNDSAGIQFVGSF